MGEVMIYALIATIITCIAMVDLIRPVIQARVMPLDVRILFYIVNFILAWLIAPLMVYPILVPSAGAEFMDKLDSNMFAKN